MGEPNHIYSRHFDFPVWPVASASELADYAEWLIDLVRQEISAEPEITLNVQVFGRDSEPSIPLDEFRERFDEFPFDKVFGASLDVWNPRRSLTLEFGLNSSILGDNTAVVTVSGTDKERVQRIKSRVREEGEARLKLLREAEARAKADADFERQKAAAGIGDVAGAIFEAEAKRERERNRRSALREVTTSKEPEPPNSPSRFNRFIHHPVTIGLIVTVVGSVIAALIVAAILSA
jgi:hypothetical protein